MLTVSQAFARLPDHRRGNASYPLADVLGSAFAMFSLKSPSLLSFREQTRQERRNLRAIYHLTDIPGDTQMRAALDPVAPQPLRALFAIPFATLQEAGVVKEYHYWQHHVIVASDGVTHCASTKIHCHHCTTRTHRGGTTAYHHAGLAAVLLHPDHEEVFPLDFEPLLNHDGDHKNDCQRTAAKRLCTALHERYAGLPVLLVEDALDATAPHLRQIQSYGWSYVLNVKPDSHPSLVKQCAGRRASGQVSELRLFRQLILCVLRFPVTARQFVNADHRAVNAQRRAAFAFDLPFADESEIRLRATNFQQRLKSVTHSHLVRHAQPRVSLQLLVIGRNRLVRGFQAQNFHQVR
ncbi:MAG: hypothetical protein M3371_08205 [Acidobacteriota bacterium]|nr:hypothetical protein [Acidobacteriota bacterium]